MKKGGVLGKNERSFIKFRQKIPGKPDGCESMGVNDVRFEVDKAFNGFLGERNTNVVGGVINLDGRETDYACRLVFMVRNAWSENQDGVALFLKSFGQVFYADTNAVQLG